MRTLDSQYIGLELSSGTLRSEDLIPNFVGFLDHVAEICGIQTEVAALKKEVATLGLEDIPGYSGPYYKDPETASFLLYEDIYNLLNQIAPEHCYFGCSEGDGASLGFWLDEESLGDRIVDDLERIIESRETQTMIQKIRNLADDLAPYQT